ncbi:CoA-binding protein [Filobacillus milosensis]|uniref:CoA-binding protein n=1 Tax=Filobacillus milosensis TaxID=94137 RepID=A0A4Y8IP35_9BACI|nr:CoA-binding protein [Filobacillus milosensis]TFB23343.1 CoA-binding protein [Filobacillus milosensis]
MFMKNPSNDQLSEILVNSKTIAVVGLSDKPDRTSYQVAKVMQQQGYKIIPVNPNVDEVLGEKAYNTLEEIEESIDIINVFRRSEFLMDVAHDALKTDCKIFWAQLGVSDEKAYQLLKEHDFIVIMDLCIKVVHSVTVGNRN